MSDAIETAVDAKSVALEVGKFAAKAAVQSTVEVTAAISILVVAGYAYSKIEERRAKKAAAKLVAVQQ